jgi:cytochrome P450
VKTTFATAPAERRIWWGRSVGGGMERNVGQQVAEVHQPSAGARWRGPEGPVHLVLIYPLYLRVWLILPQATIAEVQRLACVTPFSLPHYTQAPTTVGEFTFPAKSVFFANLSFISNDPDHFGNASDFAPTRFLSADGRWALSQGTVVDTLVRFEHNERLIPFGVGRRYCMGEQLARGQVFIALADLIQRLRQGAAHCNQFMQHCK